ncbi:MAG: hypothetical protein ABI969_19440, partial [bacterium]
MWTHKRVVAVAGAALFLVACGEQLTAPTSARAPAPGGVSRYLGPTTVSLTVRPSSPEVTTSNVAGVAGDYASGHASGSIASNGVAKSEIYLTPAALFGRDVTLSEIASMSYFTKKGTTHAVEPRDWYLTIYTKPFVGQSTAQWYGARIGTEPYFSANILDPASTWNQWSTIGGTNTLRFFESTAGATGATFGSYSDPHWSAFVAGNALSGPATTGGPYSYAGQSLLLFSVQTGSAWAAGFTGQLDGLEITLTDGSVATVNFEPNLPACTTTCYADAVGGNDANGGASAADAKK